MSPRDTTKRLFVAVDLSLGIVERLVRVQEELQNDLPAGVHVRWVDAPNIHVTLTFLGETEASLVPMIEERLETMVRPLFPFEVQCLSIGAFPDPSQARIVWAGLDQKGAEVMGLLRLSIEQQLGELGFAADDREYRPHVTLGRVKARSTVDLSKALARFDQMAFGECYVRDFVLFESTLTPEGAKYDVLNRFPLGES